MYYTFLIKVNNKFFEVTFAIAHAYGDFYEYETIEKFCRKISLHNNSIPVGFTPNSIRSIVGGIECLEYPATTVKRVYEVNKADIENLHYIECFKK